MFARTVCRWSWSRPVVASAPTTSFHCCYVIASFSWALRSATRWPTRSWRSCCSCSRTTLTATFICTSTAPAGKPMPAWRSTTRCSWSARPCRPRALAWRPAPRRSSWAPPKPASPQTSPRPRSSTGTGRFTGNQRGFGARSVCGADGSVRSAVGPGELADGANQIVEVERFGDAGVDGHLVHALQRLVDGADDDDRHVVAQLLVVARLHEGETVHHGHHQIEHDGGRAPRAHGVERLTPVGGQVHHVALTAEGL